MDVRCILCEALVESVETAVLQPEGPDVVCVHCRALAPEERRMLREQAMVRMLREETSSRRRE